MRKTLKTYYDLVKPGIIYGNAITCAAGFFLASGGYPDYARLAFTLVGLSLVIAGGCVFNNYIDRDIDARMERTKNRAFVVGNVSISYALLYAIALVFAGFGLLIFYVNHLAASLAFLGFVIYVFVYSLWAKRKSVYATHVGALAGAIPPVVGYVAVTGAFDTGAIILFFILALWQIPHFFSIVVRRAEDYQSASVPALPLKRSERETNIQILLYIALFMFAAAALTELGYAGVWYLTVALICSAAWFAVAARGFIAADRKKWARHAFLVSLVVLLAVSIGMSLDATPAQKTPPAYDAGLS